MISLAACDCHLSLSLQCQAKEDQLLEEEGRVQCLNRELAQLQKSMLSLQTKLQEEKHNTDLEVSLVIFGSCPVHCEIFVVI